MGEIQLAVRFTCSSLFNMMEMYSQPLLPKMHYIHPLTVAQLESLRHHATQIVSMRLSRAEPPLRKEVVEFMLDKGSHMWSARRGKANFFRIMGALGGLIAVGKWFDQNILPNNALPDELDEEFDTFPSSRPADILRMRYDRLRSISSRVQNVMGDLATQCERLQSLLSWRDPRATGLFVSFCLTGAIVLYFILPLKGVNCPNLEVLYTTSISDGGLENFSKYCKNLRKLYVTSRMGYVTQKGLLALAPGCPKLECLHINLSSITYDVMAYIGMRMKNLYELNLVILYKGIRKKNLVLDKGIRTLLIGCNKLERLSICFEELGGLSDESLKNIGMCGYNLRYLSLCYVGESDAGLVELSFGCPKLQALINFVSQYVVSVCSGESWGLFIDSARLNVVSTFQFFCYVGF
ncbi:FT-interacting protein 3 [Tanacetum coccineum]